MVYQVSKQQYISALSTIFKINDLRVCLSRIEENFKLKSEDQDDPEVAKLLRQYRASSSKCYKRNLMKEKREVQAEDEIDTSDISTDPEWSNEIENKPEADEPQGMEIDSTIPVAPVTTTQSVEGEAKAAVTSSDEPKKIFRKTVHVPVNRSKKVEVGSLFTSKES